MRKYFLLNFFFRFGQILGLSEFFQSSNECFSSQSFKTATNWWKMSSEIFQNFSCYNFCCFLQQKLFSSYRICGNVTFKFGLVQYQFKVLSSNKV